MTSPRFPHIVAALMSLAVACGGASQEAATAPSPHQATDPTLPDTGDNQAGQAAAPGGFLHIAPFKITIQKQGSAERTELTGDAEGNLTMERFGKDGKSEKRVLGVRVTADGHLTGKDVPPDMVALAADGTLLFDGKPTSAKVASDGTVSKDGKVGMRIEGGKVVNLAGVLSSKVSVNGKVVEESHWTATVEGDDATRQLAAFVLVATMSGRSVETSAGGGRHLVQVAVPMAPVSGSKMKPIEVTLKQVDDATTVTAGFFQGLKPGLYHFVVHEKGDCSHKAARAGKAWAGAAALDLSMKVDAQGGNIDESGLPIQVADLGGHALVLHADKKGKPGKPVACGVIPAALPEPGAAAPAARAGPGPGPGARAPALSHRPAASVAGRTAASPLAGLAAVVFCATAGDLGASSLRGQPPHRRPGP